MSRDTSIGNRMKMKELRHESFLNPDLPAAVIRLDGHKFSKFCKKFKKPFDIDYRQIMVDTAKHLTKHYQAEIGYTQSDEISIVITPKKVSKNNHEKEFIHKGRCQKICSLMASKASTYFMFQLMKRMPHIELEEDNLPIFDARIYALSLMEGFNSLLWREQDCVKNSISMSADNIVGKRKTVGVNSQEKQAMMYELGFNWNDLDTNFKRGTYVRKENYQVELTEEQLAKIPKHQVPENNMVTRSRMVALKLPPIVEIENRIEFIFEGAEPIFNKNKRRESTSIK